MMNDTDLEEGAAQAAPPEGERDEPILSLEEMRRRVEEVETQIKVVSVPQLGKLKIRPINMTDQQFAEKAATKESENGKKRVDGKLRQAYLLTRAVVEPKMTINDAEWFVRKATVGVVGRLMREILVFSGLNPKELDDALGFSDQPSAD